MKRLSKNALSFILSDVMRRVLGFLAVAYLARTVGASGFGVISIGFSVLAYALLASSAGLSTYGTREIAKGGAPSLVKKIASLRLALALLVYIIVVVIIAMVVPDIVTAGVIIICCLSIFANAALLDWYFQGKEEMTIVGIGRVLSAGIYVLVLFGFVHSEHNILWVPVGAVIGDLIATIFLLKVYRNRYGSLSLAYEPAEWKPLVEKSVLLSGGNILGNLSINLPPLVIGVIMTNIQVGVYSAASRLVVFLLMLDRTLAALLLPAASRLHAATSEKLADRLGLALKWIIAVGLPLSVGGSLLSNKIISLVYGAQYGDAAPVFRVLIWYFFITMLHTVFTSGLLAMGQEKAYLNTMGISALIYGASVIVCTKTFGILGAAAAMVGSEAITLVLMRRQFRKFVKLYEVNNIVKALPAALIMGFVVFVGSSLPLIGSIILGGIVYVGVIYFTKAITLTDLKELLERV